MGATLNKVSNAIHVISLLLAGWLAAVAFQAGAALCPDHPRMFFNAETWPAMKARAEGPAAAELKALLARARSYPENPVCAGTETVSEIKTATGSVKSNSSTPIPDVREWGLEAAECALAWRFTGDRAFLEKARRMLEVSIAAYQEAYRNRRAVSWYSTTRILACCAYDWIHEGLTPDQRRAIIVPLVQHIEDVQPGKGKPAILRRNSSGVETGFYGVQSLLWYSGIAAAGDGFCDELAAKHLAQGRELGFKLLDWRATTAGDDGALGSATTLYCLGAYPWAHFNFMHTYLSAFGENLAGRYGALALFPNWIYWTWIVNAKDPQNPLYFGAGDDHHRTNRMGAEFLYGHLTQYMHFFREVNPDAARLAAALRQRVPQNGIIAQSRPFSGLWPVYPFVVDDDCGVKPLSADELANPAEKARHFESLGQFLMRSGWTADSTYCLFTAGATLRHHKHHDENAFAIFKHDFLALDSGTRAAQTDYNLLHYYAQTVAHNCILIHKPGEPLPNHWGLRDRSDAGRTNYGGQYGVAKPLAYETNDRFTYVASDATEAYGKKCREAVRQFIHLQPDYFLVYDRVESADPSYRKEWLLHTANMPTVEGKMMRADCGKGRLYCQTLFPADACLATVGGPGKEFWANGKNWEVDANYLKQAQAEAEKSGRGPYFGAGRLEVSPKSPAARDTFLHVLTATDSSHGAAIPARAVSTDAQEGADLTLPDGTRVSVRFNRTGPVGGTIAFGDGPARPFRTDVQPQSGVTKFAAKKGATPRFAQCRPDGLEPRPDFWKVRPDEIISLCKGVRRGKAEVIARTPLGYPVYAVFYGDFSEPPPQANWSASNSSSSWRAYAGDAPKDRQTFLFLAGVHGAEAESVAAAVNLIQALETGSDFRGKSLDDLTELIAKYRFIVVPCLNMDGRAVSPDHLRGQPYPVFRAASQGRWLDGRPIEWLESKKHFPLPLDRVSHPGGYPNSEGYNLMHDAAPGDVKTEEVRALCRLVARWRVDAVLNGHSCESAPFLIPPAAINPPGHVKRGLEIVGRVSRALFAAGLTPVDPEKRPAPVAARGFNLNTLLMLSSGCLPLTLECSVSYDVPDKSGAKRRPKVCYTFEQLMEPPFIALGEMLRDGLEKPFINRAKW